MATSKSKLNEIYKRYVMYDQYEMADNKKTAHTVLCNFQIFLTEEHKVEVDWMPQGSSYEDARVGQPDQLDFLLVFDHGTSVKPREVGKPPGDKSNSEHSPGYWELVSGKPNAFCEGELLSTKKFKARLQPYVNNFVHKNQGTIPNVESMETDKQLSANVTDPGITLLVQKMGGTQFTINITICIKSTISGWFSKSQRCFIATKNASKESETFWLVSNSQKERALFLRVSNTTKINYRVLKFLLNSVIDNSFVVKTAFLHVHEKNHDKTPLDVPKDFITKILEELRTAYLSAYLPAYNNKQENVLARYSKDIVQDKYQYISRLCNKDYAMVVDELIELAVPSPYVRLSIETEAKKEDARNSCFGCKMIGCKVM